MRYKSVSLGDISNITKLAGFEFAKYISYDDTGEIIALRALNLRNGELDLSDVKRIKRSVSESLERSRLHKDDILLTYTGNGYGDCAIITENDKYHLAPNICKISPYSNLVHPYFLYSYIRSKNFYSQMSNHMVGSSQPTIPMKTIRVLEVPLPPPEIQKKIVAMLYILDQKIRLNQRINDNLERQAQALYKAWFVDFEPFLDGELVPSCFGLIPHNWSVKRLNEITQNIRTKVKDKKCKVFSAVNTGTLQLSEDYFTKQVFSKNICNYIVVEENDFAYNPARVNIGSIGMNDLGVTGCVSPVYVVVRTEPDYHYFFNFFLKTGRFKEEVKLRASGSVRQSMNYSDFGLIEIVYPPHDIVKKFNSLYEPLLNSINHIKKENQKLSEIRDAILPQLMSGELDVSNVFL